MCVCVCVCVFVCVNFHFAFVINFGDLKLMQFSCNVLFALRATRKEKVSYIIIHTITKHNREKQKKCC